MPDLLLPLPAPMKSTRACLVLVDLVGSTNIARTLPLTHYTALMAEFVQVMVLSFEAAGGEVLQHQGDAVLALWSGGRAQQAAAAAMQAHERAARIALAEMLGVRLQLRAGVALGDVLTGMVGGQPSAYGLPVNLSRRLCEGAAPGETMVCPTMLARLGTGDWPATMRLLAMQGIGEDCAAFALHARPAARSA